MNRRLRDLNLDDLFQAAGATRLVARFPVLRRLGDAPANALADLLAAFDTQIARGDRASAAQKLLLRLGQRPDLGGVPLVTTGPRLFVSNHPGLGDALALLSVLDQPDLKVVARERDFLAALPAFHRSLLVVPEKNPAQVLRDIEAHLKGGGGVLTFPAGSIEPDPAWLPVTGQFERWSRSTELFVRRVPLLTVQPLLVGGTRLEGFVDPWLARWRRRPADREWTAAVLQLAWQVFRGRTFRGRLARLLPVTVMAGPPLHRAPSASDLEALVSALREWRRR